jgi:hypothetical protein
VRCIIDTLAPGRRDAFRGEQLYGRAGTVHSTRWDGWNARWSVVVSDDHLTRATMPERVTMEHRPGELVPSEAWASLDLGAPVDRSVDDVDRAIDHWLLCCWHAS